MARDYDDMEDDNPIQEDFEGASFHECEECGTLCDDDERFYCPRCERRYYERDED